MTLDLRHHFSIFRDAAPGRIHLAAHSHHYWPDAACRAHEEAVRQAARLADAKWEPIFQELMPRLQRAIARILNLPDPGTLAFAPNTHELVCRLMSSLPLTRPPRVLTSDCEFHSFERQLARLAEEHLVEVTRVAVLPSDSFPERFLAAAASGEHDLIFVSQVFYNCGATCGDIAALTEAVASPQALIAVDGYHGFMALPTDLQRVAPRIFYLAGGYKYAMAGEGACFMHCPPGYAPRPRDTGWFAGFGALESAAAASAASTSAVSDAIAYGVDGSRFMGATFDPSGLHRLAAVLDWMSGIGLTVEAIHAHVLSLQDRFRTGVKVAPIAPLRDACLLTPMATAERGHFLCYDTPQAASINARLAQAGIVTDVRGTRLRIGFGCYHTVADIDHAVAAIAAVLA
jgi:selenocysteine lyase/cysteine desulfurase